MNILICDDIKRESEMLLLLLKNSGFDINAVTFDNGYDVLDYLNIGGLVDACFLDIIMPGLNGVELAEKLRENGHDTEIIFCTSSNEYAYESYKVRAFDYLLKPPTLDSIRQVLEKLERARNDADMERILLKTSGAVKSVLLRDTSHVEVINHKVYFRLKDGGEIKVYATFAEIAAELLAYPRFVQCHRSYIVNMEDIAEISSFEIVMRNGDKIPVSRKYSEAKSIFFAWKFGGDM